MPQNRTGFSLQDTSIIKEEVQDVYGDALPDISLEDATPQGMLINIEVARRVQMFELFSYLVNQYSVDSAKGVYLDTLYSNYDIRRIKDTPSYATVTFYGTPNAVILRGSVVKSTAGDEFLTLTQDSITSSGSVSIGVRATTVGCVPVNINTITTIQSAIPNVTTCDNLTLGVLGTVLETDPQFRRRAGELVGKQGVGSLQAIRANVLDVEGVTTVVIVENDSNSAVIKDGKTLVPHSVYCVVDGGRSEAIGHALQHAKTVGSAYNGEVAVDISVVGVSYRVLFDRPTPVSTKIRVTVDKTLVVPVSDQDVKDTILQYYSDNIELGSSVTPTDLTGYLYENLLGIRITSLEAGLTGGDFSFVSTNIKFWEIATLNIIDIEVG